MKAGCLVFLLFLSSAAALRFWYFESCEVSSSYNTIGNDSFCKTINPGMQNSFMDLFLVFKRAVNPIVSINNIFFTDNNRLMEIGMRQKVHIIVNTPQIDFEMKIRLYGKKTFNSMIRSKNASMCGWRTNPALTWLNGRIGNAADRLPNCPYSETNVSLSFAF
jgi:hypothetical protein